MPTTTYGKRSVKRKNTVEGYEYSSTMVAASTSTPMVEERSDEDDDEIPLQPSKNATQKKRRIEDMKPSGGNTQPHRTAPVVYESTEEEDEAPKPRVTRTYGTPKKATSTAPRPSPTIKSSLSQGSLSSSAMLSSKQGDASNSPVTSSNHGSPTKLAKRMLARSKTDTSVTEVQKNLFSPIDKRTPSLPILPSASQSSSLLPQSPSRSPSRTDTLLDVSSSIQPIGVSSSSSLLPLPAPPPLAGNSKTLSRTYAGRSRSYLASSAPEINGDGTIDDPDEARESYSSLRMRWGVDESEDDPYYHIDESQTARDDESSHSLSPRKGSRSHGARGGTSMSATGTPHASPSKHRDKNGKTNGSQQPRPPPLPSNMMNPLKSITELRNKGESRRFLDEVAYLLDGMAKSQGSGLIRASALEMVTKLCDGEFFRKAKASDVFAKVYDLFTNAGVGHGDKILDILFVFFVVLISKDSPSLAELATHIPDIRKNTPVTSNAKGKGKAVSEEPFQPLVDILFLILRTTCTHTSDPLVLVSKGNTFNDAQLRVAGLGKKEKNTMVTILSVVQDKSNIFPPGSKIATPLLITHILQSISPSLIPQHHLPGLLQSLRECLHPLHAWNDTSSSKLELDLDVDFENVFGHLRLLDLYLLGQWESPNENPQSQSQDPSANDEALLEARQAWLIDGLVMLGIYAEVALQHDRKSREKDEGATKCLESVLRVLVSLTHGDEGWGRNVAIENARGLPFLLRVAAKSGEEVEKGRFEALSGVKKEEDEDEDEGNVSGEDEDRRFTVSRSERKARALDRLCLSLALLTNLVQAVNDVKDLIRETYLDPTCSLRNGQCLDACSCRTNNASALELLVQLYIRQQSDLVVKKEEDDVDDERLQMDADASFLRGHLAVLFGLLMQGNEKNQGALQEMLPGGQSKAEVKIKLNRLVDQARQFVAFFTVVLGQESGEKETRRLEDRERESSSRVAKEIVEFLARLRDAA